MALKNDKSMATCSKTGDAKFVDNGIYVVTNSRAVCPMTRSIIRPFTQSSMEAPFTSTPIFGSTSSKISSSILGLKDVSASIEKTLVMLKIGSTSKLLKPDNDLSNIVSESSHETL